MEENMDLKALEKKAWKTFFDDGLWDIYLGLLLALMGISALLDKTALSEGQSMGVYIGLMLIVMAAFFAGKKFITVPRMGHVKFGATRQKKQKNLRLILFLSFAVGLAAYWLFEGVNSGSIETDFSLNNIFPLIYAGNMVIVFGLMAYFMDFERLYFIGLMYALPVPLDRWLYASYGIDLDYLFFALPASLVVIVGIWYLVRFLKTYPHVQGNV
ncbi:MAG: hypothetical protein HN560_08175 [Anaerolineae bacterium]|jgi:hypothetical protein|nr:hypothetical protein [Anaerolineae bacterium]MBT7072248.1 hypothetical protein [Anaerolineae bacterium]MBT7601038.1 hypothetical protein [Anaerolineae bacterium]MBT7990675.1 hypothetical protein [Anaerolineae bacterium]